MQKKIDVSKLTFKNLVSLVSCLVFILFPILDDYKGIGKILSLGELLLLILTLISIPLLKKIRVSLQDKSIVLLVLFFLIITIFDLICNPNLLINDSIFLLLRIVMYTFFIIVMSKIINIDQALKIYEWCCLIFCFYLVFQYISYYFFNYILSSYLSFFEIKSSLVSYATRDMSYVYSIVFRPSSLFSEPAKLVQFLSPYLIFLLYNDKIYTYHIPKIIFITISFILSTSFMGILLLLSIYILYFIKNIIKGMGIQKILIFVSVIIVILVICMNTGIVNTNISRMMNGITKSASTSSAGLRLLRGWEIFFKLPILNKLIGVGLGQVANYISCNNISIYFGGEYAYGEYMNTFTYILNCTGLIGSIVYLSYLKTLYSRGNVWIQQIVLIILIMGFGGSFLVTPTWVFYMTLIFLEMNNQKLLNKK